MREFVHEFLENVCFICKGGGVYAALSEHLWCCRFVYQYVISIALMATTQGNVVLLIYYYSACNGEMIADGNGAGASVSPDFLLGGFMPGGGQNCSAESRFIKTRSQHLAPLSRCHTCNQLFNDTSEQKKKNEARRCSAVGLKLLSGCLASDGNAKGSLINITLSWILCFIIESKNDMQALWKRPPGVANVTSSDLVQH